MNATNSNSTNGSVASNFSPPAYYKEDLALKVFKLALQTSIGLIGVIGNLLVCVVVTNRANMKTVMNYHIRNLAIADLGVLLVNYPISVMQEQHTSGYLLGRWFCIYVAPSTEVFFGASIWSITVIAIERYRNIITRRAHSSRNVTFRNVAWKLFFVWFASLIVVAVPLYPIMVFNNHQCYPGWPDYRGNNILMKAYAIALAVFWYLLPLLIITLTYVRISRQLHQSTKFHKNMHGANSVKSKLLKEEEKQRLKQNRKAQRILTPLVVVFAVSMLPLNVFRLVQAFFAEFVFYKYYKVLLSVCALFVIINSAADPVVYYIASKEFRQGIGKLLRCWRDEKQENGKLILKSENTAATMTGRPCALVGVKETEL